MRLLSVVAAIVGYFLSKNNRHVSWTRLLRALFRVMRFTWQLLLVNGVQQLGSICIDADSRRAAVPSVWPHPNATVR